MDNERTLYYLRDINTKETLDTVFAQDREKAIDFFAMRNIGKGRFLITYDVVDGQKELGIQIF